MAEYIDSIKSASKKDKVLVALIILFFVSIFNTFAFELYSTIVAPLLLSYIISSKVTEYVFTIHRGTIPVFSKTAGVKYLKPVNRYYRFASPYKVNIFDLLKFTFFPFLFYMGMTVQRQNIYANLFFPIWFVLLTAVLIFDKSGLRYVDTNNQSIQRIGKWYGAKLKTILSIFVSFSFIANIFLLGNLAEAARFFLTVSLRIYPQIFVVSFVYVIFVLPENRRDFLLALTNKYGITRKTVEISLVEKPVYHPMQQ